MKELALTIGNEVIEAPGNLQTGGFGTDLGNTLLGNALQLFLIAGVVLALTYLIWGGIQWVTSTGDKQKLTNARNKIMYAIIGLIVMSLSIAIINLVITFLGGREIGAPPAVESAKTQRAMTGIV